jgi:apolipoprotein N-acyltransferase
MMGANRVERDAFGQARYFNSLVALTSDGVQTRIVAHYDKYRLVPFGEFIPAGDLMGRLGVRSLVHMPDDFTGGPEPLPMALPGQPPVQPLICYEGLFPRFTGEAASRSGVRPRWILNVSNDSWFGATSGPLQHLNLSSYRAIEEGLPMVRATPTGVSAVIDARGRIAPDLRLGLGVEGVIDARLPAALPATLYSRFGEAAFLAMLLISTLGAFAARIRRT